MNTLTTLFDWLLAASLRASALTLAVLALQLVLHRHLSPRWRYALWLPVLAVLLMPVHAKSRWSVENAFLSAVQPKAPSAAVPGEEVMEEPTMTMTEPMPAEPTGVVTASAPMDWRKAGMVLWLGGAVGILLCGMVSFRRVLAGFKASRQPVGEKLQTLISQTAQEVGLRDAPQVWVSPDISSPAVTGLFRPALLLPERFDHAFTFSEVRLILQHELMHLKRRDLQVNAVLCVLMALHWFNPVLWLAFLKVRADREAACDAQVLEDAPHARRVEYGHALLKVESAFSPLSLSLGFVGIFQRGTALRGRIRAIATQRRAHPVMNGVAVLAMLALTFFGVTRAEDVGFSVGQAVFRAGDSIRITSVLRTADLLSVSVEYELGSREEATLALYITSLTNSEPVPHDPRQSMTVTKGRGIATLHQAKPQAGLPHVTFYDKVTHQGIGGVYFGTGEEAAQSKLMKLSYLSDAKESPASGFIKNKVEKIILPRVVFEKVSLEEALEFLRLVSRDHDTTTTNEKLKGVPIILRKGDGPEASISVSLTDIPLNEALRYITELAGYKYSVEPYAVVVQKAGETKVIQSTNAGLQQSMKAAPPPGNAGNIIIPDIKFNGLTLEEALEFIRIKAREIDPAKKGVNIILKQGDQPQVALTLDLKDVPLPEALHYIAELSNHTLSSGANGYMLTPASR